MHINFYVEMKIVNIQKVNQFLSFNNQVTLIYKKTLRNNF